MLNVLRQTLFSPRGQFFIKNSLQPICTTIEKRVKEIRIHEEGDQITIEGHPIESDRTEHLIKIPKYEKNQSNCVCPLCRLDLKRLEYSDVLILSQFIESSGCLMSQPDTGLCSYSYKKIKFLVRQAQSAQLLPRPPEYQCYGPWDNLNHYYEYPKRVRDLPKSVIRKEYWK